jgi:hypothetical protein
VEELDRDVRAAIARSIGERGTIPTIAHVAATLRLPVDEIDASFGRMIDGHVFIPRSGSHEIYAYNPFCVGPTAFRISAGGRDWWAICGWDALGIPAALGTEGTVETTCGDGCGERIRIDVGSGGHATGEAVWHSGVPARQAWDDITYT